jgi:HAD superfamily hydrolase (TIGR01662 family)
MSGAGRDGAGTGGARMDGAPASPVAAVFFDVDFTLIYPGPTFQGVGYHRFCEGHGIVVDPDRFPDAVRAASALLDEHQEHVYEDAVFVRYTRRIIEEMGGTGPALDACAREIYMEWAASHHFFLYDDVAEVLQLLAARGLRLGLISNSHRPMDAFQAHFGLRRLISAAVSSAEHGRMKPHPSIFEEALSQAGVRADQAVMVGDSLSHDIEGARRVGMRGVLVHRSPGPVPADTPAYGVPVIRSLTELPGLILDPGPSTFACGV